LRDGQRIDQCLIIFFSAPRSYTGEDLVEISLHSNPCLVEEIVEMAVEQGARPALAGEFTYRAYLHDKLDLIQAEAVNDLIHANSRYFARTSFSNLEGGLTRLADDLKADLKEFAILLETQIEFSEENHLPYQSLQDLRQKVSDTIRIVDKMLQNARYHDQLTDGLKVVIMGRSNVGKSTLFNALLDRDRAITSPYPHTTRDFIEDRLYIQGFPVILTDIAGIEGGQLDTVDSEGIQRSYQKIRQAGAIIFMVDASRDFSKADRELYSLSGQKKTLICINKMDKALSETVRTVEEFFQDRETVRISLLQNPALAPILDFLRSLVTESRSHLADYTVNQRQRDLLQKTRKNLETIDTLLNKHFDRPGSLEIIAEENRLALEHLGKMLGEIEPEDILRDIFSRFCIGK
jgi:tRNA modification GTPase